MCENEKTELKIVIWGSKSVVCSCRSHFMAVDLFQ